MSNDPYHVVQAEIQSTLQTAVTLLASYRRIRSTARADSEELGYARNEVSLEILVCLEGRTALEMSLLGGKDMFVTRLTDYLQLKATLSSLEADLDDLEESVRCVKSATYNSHWELTIIRCPSVQSR